MGILSRVTRQVPVSKTVTVDGKTLEVEAAGFATVQVHSLSFSSDPFLCKFRGRRMETTRRPEESSPADKEKPCHSINA